LGDEIVENEMGETCCMNGERKHSYRDLVRKSKGKRPLGISRRRWEDNIVMNLKEIRLDCVHWIRLTADRGSWRALVSIVINQHVHIDFKSMPSTCFVHNCDHPQVHYKGCVTKHSWGLPQEWPKHVGGKLYIM
jgi:hypothetical protein